MKKTNQDKEKGRIGEREIFFSARLFLSFSIVMFGFGCQPNQTILKDVTPPPTPLSTVEMKKTTFEEDLREMKTADFDYILVFRRKDGGTFVKEDRKYLRENTPLETNRWRESDGGKAFIAGSGFGFAPEQIETLKKRFIVEDYSKPEIKNAANSNAANTNTNVNKTANANK